MVGADDQVRSVFSDILETAQIKISIDMGHIFELFMFS